MSFKAYYEKRLFMEMPKVPGGSEVYLDDDDASYLQPFLDHVKDKYGETFKDKPEEYRRLVELVVSKALAYRYSEKVLGHPDEPDERVVPIETRLDKLQLKFEVKTNVHAQKLVDKLDTLGYDPLKFNLNRITTDRVAREWVANKIYKDDDKVPSISMYYALKSQNATPETKTRGKLTMGMTNIGRYSKGAPSIDNHVDNIKSVGTSKSSRKLKEPIPLDDDDKELINYFVRATGTTVPKPGDRNRVFPKGLVPAFYKKYSGELFNDPQVKNPPREFKDHPPGEYMNLNLNGKMFFGVPIHLDRLKRRLAELKEKGVDFIEHPLDRTSAMNWIVNGKYGAGARAKLEKDRTFEAGKEGGVLEKFIKDQEAHLREPDKVPSPNIRSANSKRQTDDDELTWHDILDNDAKHAARMGIAAAKAATTKDSGMLDDMAFEDLANQAFTFLLSDDAVLKPEYANQDWRIEQAKNFVRQKAKEMIDGGGKEAGDTDMTALAGGRDTADQLKDKEKERQEEIGAYDIPTAKDVENDDPAPGGVKAAIGSYLTLQLHLNDDFTDPELDQIADTVAKIVYKFKELNDEPPNKEVMKHIVDGVIDDFRKKTTTKKIDLPKPPDAALGAMRAAEKPPRSTTPVVLSKDDVPDKVNANIGGDAKLTGGQFKSPLDFLKARRAAMGKTPEANPAPVAPTSPPPPPLAPSKPVEIPAEKKKSGKKKKPEKKSGPSLFDDIDTDDIPPL